MAAPSPARGSITTPPDAFISYSNKDLDIANAVVDGLEDAGIQCWIAPRDITPGHDWSAAIPPAIDACRIFILIFSEDSNASPQIAREVHIAQSGVAKLVIPFRIDPVAPSGPLRYLLAGLHWLNAVGDTRAAKVGELIERVRTVLEPPDNAIESLPSTQIEIPNNLPLEPNAFVGREHEIEEVASTIRERAVVSLVGTGGVGKTRLALRAARTVLHEFVDGVWFVRLASIVDGGLVVSTIAETIGFAEKAGEDPAETLAANISSKKILVVLDNCEQVIAACAEFASVISSSCQNARILCTTRTPLGIGGECVVRLQPLASPAASAIAPSIEQLNVSPAVRLFLDRAAAVAPVMLPSESARSAVAEIVRHLDGLPLALELAAARTNVLSFEQIAASIDQRFRLLTTGRRTAEPRHRTLAALIDWSFELLDEDERKILSRLSVFRGGCTLETAATVCGDGSIDEWRMLDLLSSLADKSLLVVRTDEARKRYEQLESIRDYSREKLLNAGEAQVFAARRTAAFAAIGDAAYQEWDLAPRFDWLSRLSPDLDNFRAALSDALENENDPVVGTKMAANLGPVFMRLSLLREGVDWCRRALAASPTPEVGARLNYVLSSLHYNRGEARAALSAAETAARLYSETADERGYTRALSQVAQLSAHESRPKEAREAARAAIERARALGDDRLLANVLQRCGVVLDPSEIDQAREQFAECVRLFRSLGRDDETARALMWWAGAEAEAESFSRARELSIEALQLIGTGDGEMALKSNIAFFSIVLGDQESAATHARDALDLAARTHNPMMIPIVISYIAVLVHDGAPTRAARLLGYAESRLAEMDWHQTPVERKIHANLQLPLRAKFTNERLTELLAEGAALSDDRAVAEALDAI